MIWPLFDCFKCRLSYQYLTVVCRRFLLLIYYVCR